jgi:hypothetical protein
MPELKAAYVVDIPGEYAFVEFIPQNQNIGDWSEMFTIMFLEGEKRTPERFVNGLYGLKKFQCAHAYWSVIESDELSVLYEWSLDDCRGFEDQHQISRILQGNDGLHSVGYVQKTNKMPEDTRNLWIKRLRSAYVVMGDSSVPIVLRKAAFQ